MNRTQLIFAAALFGAVSGATLAAEPASDGPRRERMDQAYEDYRNPQPGPAARAESSMKRGVHRTGAAIENGAKRAGHAIGKGVRKTGEVIGRGGEKMEEKSAPKP